jgi:putative mRNA 3-end processing factor
MSLLICNENGIYCPEGDFYIDPWKPVKKALITHGHSDHARYGHTQYMCTEQSVPILRQRLGDISVKGVSYGQKLRIRGVNVSFHLAGHIPGSAQIRVEYKGVTWVVSGDYKLADDNISGVFEPVRCDHFITESTFGLPVFNWKPQKMIFDEINGWWEENKVAGKTSMLIAYSLGKAQRVLKGLDMSIGPVYTHASVDQMNETLRTIGINLPPTQKITQETDRKMLLGSMIIAPPSAAGSTWARKFPTLSTGMASGWMSLRGARRRRAADRGFILSDHADWNGLNEVIRLTGAENIYVTHGYTDIFSRWLTDNGLNAQVLRTDYGEETEEALDKQITDTYEEL